MEQRKVLLIIVSVSIVLAAIIGVGIWLFYPRDAAEPESIADAGGGLEWEPLDYLRGDGEVPGLEEDAGEEDAAEEDGDFVVTYGVAEDEVREPDGDRGFVTEEPTPDVSRPPDTPTDTSAAGQAPADTEPTPAAGTETPDATVTPRTTTASRTQTTTARTAPPTRAPAPPPSTTERADRAYWVQAISSPNRDTIEQAQRTLREHQLGTRILTKEIGGITYFRLRLGPFAVRGEAEKFLGWVIEIDGFSDSMIFVDYTTAVLAAQPQ